MKPRHRSSVLAPLLVIVAAATSGCQPRASTELVRTLEHDQVLQATLTDVRLGDGVPITLATTVRWSVENPKGFLRQFENAQSYGEQVLTPRAREVAARVASTFPTVDAVFTEDRESFTQGMKAALLQGLPQQGVTIREVILSDLVFPQRFTEAMEQVALKELEVQAIEQRSQVDLEQAKAAGSKAEAEGEVAIKRAQTDAKVAEISAQAEQKRRESALAKAETEAQIAERNAKVEAQRIRELAKAELEKRQALDQAEAARQRELAKVELEKRQAMDLAEVAKQREVANAELERRTAVDQLDISKQRELERLAREKEEALAKLYAANPAYASFQVNRELASKVQIAVLPLGADAGMLSGLVQGAMSKGR